MDFGTIIGFLAPLILTFLVQGLKKVFAMKGYLALAIVFVIGGISALIGVGPKPGITWIDTTVNSGWIIGLSTFIYSLIKPKASV